MIEATAEHLCSAAEDGAAPLRDRRRFRFMLPLRPRSWRYAAAMLGVGAIFAATPWHALRYPLGSAAAAPEPGWREAPRDWVALAHAVAQPADFRPFEPLLEEVAGAPPLTHHAIEFHPMPRGRAGEVGSYASRHIDLYGAAPFDRQDHSYRCAEVRVCGGLDLCRGLDEPTPTDWIRGRNVARWVHEQGHYYEGYPRSWFRTVERQWVSETAAIALVFAFAEHLGQDASPVLAANLLLSQLVPVEGNTHFELSPRSRREVLELLEDTPDDDASIERLAAAAVLVLRASGLGSFREVWRFAHERTPAEVAQRVRAYAPRLGAGFQLTVDLALALTGEPLPGSSLPPPPAAVDPAALGSLVRLGRDECVEAWYEGHVVSFCAPGHGARVEVATLAPRRVVARLGAEGGELCLVAADPAERPGAALVYQGGEASLHVTTAMTSPCACRSVDTPLRGAAGTRAVGTAAATLQAVAQHALGDIERAGSALERDFALRVVARLAAALPDGVPRVAPAGVAGARPRAAPRRRFRDE
ncbi:MAG TPA: hypothetical protein VGQ83_00455 [Polyangia bacterium]